MLPALTVLAAALAAVLFLRSEALRPRRRGLLFTTAAAALISVLGVVPLVGIPGAMIYELSAPWVRAILAAGYAELGDAAWPVAIVLTLTWPASLVIAYTVAFGPLRDRSRWVRWPVLFLVPYAAAVALSLWANGSASRS